MAGPWVTAGAIDPKRRHLKIFIDMTFLFTHFLLLMFGVSDAARIRLERRDTPNTND